MQTDLLLFLSIYLIVLFIIFSSGFFVLKCFKKMFFVPGFFTGLFLSFLFGLIVVVLLLSTLKAHFLSVCVFFPLVFLVAFYSEPMRFKSIEPLSNKKNRRILYFITALILVLPFIYFSVVHFKNGIYHFSSVAYDNTSYSQLSIHLLSTGIENKWAVFFSNLSSISGLEPYHYVDSWLNAFILNIFNVNALHCFYLVTYPLLLVIILSGILAIMESVTTIGYIELLLALLLLFIGPIYPIKHLNYEYNTMGCELPLHHFGEKYAVYYPFFLFSILLVLNGYIKQSLLWLLSVCIVSSTVLPAITLFFVGIFAFKLKNKKHLIPRIGLFLLLYIGFYLLFSKSNYSSSTSGHMLAYTDFKGSHYSFSWFKLSLSNFIHGLMFSLMHFFANYFYMLPLFIGVYFYLRNTSYLKPLFMLCLFCIAGLVSASVFYKLPDSHQLFTNTLPLLHCIGISFSIVLLYNGSKSTMGAISLWLFVLLIGLSNMYFGLKEYLELHNKASVSDAYMIHTKALLKNEQAQQKIGFIYNQQDYNQLQLFPDSNYLYHLSYLGLNAVPFRLSIFDVNDTVLSASSKNVQALINQHEAFFTYCANKKISPQNSDSLKLCFITDTQLKYVLIGPNTPLPQYLSKYSSEIISDSKTNLRFIRLKLF